MISLVQLLREIQSGPKAIFMAGPAGAGKTFTLNKLGIKGFTMINVDEDYEALLKKELGKEDFASMSPEELSQAAKLMRRARVTTKEKETQAVESLQSIIIDGTGAASKPLLKKKQEFGDNIVLINNDPPDYEVDTSFDPERIQQLFPMPKGKPKTPEEVAKSKVEKEKIDQEIKSLINIEQQFDTFDEAKQKVTQFTNE